MAIRSLRFLGDDILRAKAKEVTVFNERLAQLLDDMFETMENCNGVGLAAPQVGILKRVAVVGFEDKKYELVNPEIIEQSGDLEGTEGCLSVPGRRGYVIRPQKVKVKTFDRNGAEVIIEEENFLARALCHEIDHLNGVLYIDKAERMCVSEDEEEEQE
jgi:peptide deformylase